MASKSFEEALAASEKRCTRGEDIGGQGGPWDELVCWYWGLWNEIESNVFQESPGLPAEQGTSPSSNQSTENVVPVTQKNDELDVLGSGSEAFSEDAILSLVASVHNTLDSFSQDDLFGLPPKAFRDELVVLFFKHVHPLCPVFDEVEFHTAYFRKGTDLAFLQSISLVEFQALIFAGSLVILLLSLPQHNSS